MKHCVVIHDEPTAYEADCPAREPPFRGVFGGVALALVAFAYTCAPYVDFAAIKRDTPPAATSVALTETKRSDAFTLDSELLAAHPLGFAPKTFSQTAPLSSRFQWAPRTPFRQPAIHTVQSVPLPIPRPAELGSLQMVQQNKPRPNDPFEKLFGKRQTSSALAYAAADGGIRNDGTSPTPRLLSANDGMTAIYDITARTVYLPDGTKLEAHSGLGPRMDDPRHVHIKMHGATPPHVYDLAPREALFHGDEALRMHPVGGSEAIFGRTGLLTHSYLLGPNGQSNGCVSFKDYEAFLHAYKSGKVKRLVVVASVDDPQLDLQLAERQAPKYAKAYTSPARIAASQIEDDRYPKPAFTSSLASRTSSSARSLN
jgi:hypothetical protein